MEVYPPRCLGEANIACWLAELEAAILADPAHNGSVGQAGVIIVTNYSRGGATTPEGAYHSVSGHKRRYPTSIVDSVTGWRVDAVCDSNWERSPRVLEPALALAEWLGLEFQRTSIHQWFVLLNWSIGIPPLAYCDGARWEEPFETFAANIQDILRDLS